MTEKELLEITPFRIRHDYCRRAGLSFAPVAEFYEQRPAHLSIVASNRGFSLEDRIFLEQYLGKPLPEIDRRLHYRSP